jgi:hypothetical protein
MLNTQEIFNDLGVNAIVATNLMDLLGLYPNDFYDPQRFSRFQVVVDYLKQFPDDTQRFIITKATRGKLVDKLDHVFEYTNLLKQKFAQEEALENIKKEISVLEATGDPKIEMTRLQEEEMDRQIERTLEEIKIYE